ncbi:L,D-transpeptidase family protein [Clostridium uliginosum]|uniref:Putative peptidoglycan binding domain-containing protein n=1 Tax=Clostridium uliginosum TaxID=119641 RepID=A0A1I1QD41_9CLOT|nr:L,D-transpeptidase family protein [Clostridium uliginosum]SFD17133.1 Putative peptidoglycan binding domain-containing protein [Clostridium uliginosum]
MKGEKNKSNKVEKGIITFFCSLLAIYFVFLSNTISVSAKTVDKGEKEISAEAYILTLEERGGVKEQIQGSDIGLKYSEEISRVVSYDEKLLKEFVSKLSCFDGSKIIESKNAKVEYNGNGYAITKETYGNRIKKDVLYDNVVKSILNKDTTINLESIDCYENPRFIENCPIVAYANEALNKYISSNITYIFAGNTQVLDGSTIKDWIGIDENFQVTLDETKVRNYVDTMAYTYNALLGITIPVSGGYDGNNHSWIIDSSEETKELIENIKNGQTITKHPIYAQTEEASYFSDIGDTYVEIDMSSQHLWYYKNGYLIVNGDIVTGNVSGGCATPSGVYNLYYKQKDTVLRGPGYASPVCFWMPFNRGIGLHDASWRSEFGGEIYKENGSHGCVNAPYYVAKAVYDNISSGDPIICYN